MAENRTKNMEVKRILSMVRKTVHRTENNNLLLQPAMLETRLQTPMMERKMELRHMQEMQEIALVAGKAGILHLFAGCV